MNKKQEPVKVRSLPPIVDGEVNGYLTMKVDEIVWCKDPCMNTVVLVQWWGEKEPAVFRPLNVISSLNGITTNTTVSYEIRTTISLFEEYLKDCEVLHVCVTDEQFSTVIGLVSVRELYALIQDNPYHCYFPIVNTYGTRIGDLHVGFTVQFMHQSKNAHRFRYWITSDGKNMKEMSKHRTVKCQLNALDGQRQRLRQCSELHKSLLKYEFVPRCYMYDIYKCQQPRRIQPVSDSVILEILEQGQSLRDAMVRSVLEDDTELVANDLDIGVPHTNSLTGKILGTWTEDSKMYFDGADVMEFISDRSMACKTGKCDMERLKNMSPVASSWEMVEDHKAVERKCSKMSESELQAGLESSVPSEEASSNKSTGEFGFHTAVCKEVKIEPLQSETVLRDCIMKNVDSLQITVHSLTINSTGIYRYQNSVQSGIHLTRPETRQINFLQKLSEQPGTVYFVEYDLPIVRRVTQDLSKCVKETRPWHTNVKRFCSKKKMGSGIYFGQSSLHNLPTSKASLQKFLSDGSIVFRIYCWQLHQRIPVQVGEACLTMTDVLKSQSFSFSKDVEVVYRTKIPECQVLVGLLKVTIKMGARHKYFDKDCLNKLNEDFLVSSTGNNCESRKHDSEASVRHVSDPTPARRCDGFNISRRFCKNSRRMGMSTDVSEEQEFCNNGEQKVELEDEVVYPSLREVSASKPILLHGLLHISQGQGYDGLNSYLVCRTFWKDDIITSDICCKTGNPYYNFHELIPVLLSADMLKRSHNNIFAVEVWERVAEGCDRLIGVAKLPLNKFFIAYRDPVVATQLLLSEYPVIGVDGWVRVHNPVTGRLSGHLRVVLALGTEDQVQLLEVTHGLKEAVFPHSLKDFQESVEATCDDSDSIQTASVGEHISLEQCSYLNHCEPFSYSVVNRDEPFSLGQSESWARHFRNSSSDVPQSFYDHARALESLKPYCYHSSDSVPTLCSQDDDTSLSVDVSDLTGSLPSATSVLHRTKHQEGKNDGTEFQGNVATHLSFENSQAVKCNGKRPCSFLNEGSALSFKCSTIRREKHTQEPNVQFPTDIVIASHSNVVSLGTKAISQSVVDQQVKSPQHDQFLQSVVALQSHGIFSCNIDPCLSVIQQADIGISAKHQESQTDLHVIELSSSETVTLQNTPTTTKSAKCELPRSRLGDSVREACINSNEISNVQPGDFSGLQNSSFLPNECINESVKEKQLSCQCTQTSLSQISAELNTGLKSCTRPDINEPCSDFDKPDLNAASLLQIVNQASNTGQLSSLLCESSTTQPAEFDTKDSFHACIEIERAMHLHCFMERCSDETVVGTTLEPSAYVTFLHKRCCPATDESELKMVTPLATHTANPVWHWQCDTWLPSDLLTNDSKGMIFKVWQSVNGSCRDPVRDIALGSVAIDLSVLLFGMPLISGWFNIMDFAGRCSGQIKINVTPLEDLSRYNQYRISEPKMLNKLQGICYSRYHSSNTDCQQTECKKHNLKGSVAVASSCDVNCSSYDVCHVQSETSTETLPCRVKDTHTSNKTDGVIDCSVKHDAGFQDTSYLSEVLKQKLSELDDITRRLKKLHVVTNEGFTSTHEIESSFRSEAASHTSSNTEDGNEIKTAAVSFVNEEAYEGNLVPKVTNSSEVTVGYSVFSVDTNDTERSHVNIAEQNYEMPVSFSHKCENVTTNILCPLQISNFACLSSTSTDCLPQSNVTNNQTRFVKESENGIGTGTSVDHTGLLVDTCYSYGPGSGNKTTLRMREYEHGEIWSEGISKTVSNGTRLQHADIRLHLDHTDDSYRLPDYLMEMCARHLEVDTVFNPLLFYQLLSSFNGVNISDFGSEHDAGCHYKSDISTDAEPATETVESCGFGGVAAPVNVTRAESLMYIPKEHTHIRNGKLFMNSNSSNCDACMNGAGTEEAKDNINK